MHSGLHRAIRMLLALRRRFISLQCCQCTARDLRFSITRNISNLPRRIASNNGIRWYILSDYAGSSNYTTLPNTNTRQDRRIAAYPAILLDMDLCSSFRAFRSVSHIWIQRVRTAEQTDVGS